MDHMIGLARNELVCMDRNPTLDRSQAPNLGYRLGRKITSTH